MVAKVRWTYPLLVLASDWPFAYSAFDAIIPTALLNVVVVTRLHPYISKAFMIPYRHPLLVIK